MFFQKSKPTKQPEIKFFIVQFLYKIKNRQPLLATGRRKGKKKKGKEKSVCLTEKLRRIFLSTA
jgi:hypothetical protein